MVKIYTCQACTENKHEKCERGKPSYPPGSYGGSFCRCPCKGNHHFNDPDAVHNQLIKMFENATRHEKDSKKVDLMVKEKSLSEMYDEIFPSKSIIKPTPDELEDAYHRALDKVGNIVSGVFDKNIKKSKSYIKTIRALKKSITIANDMIRDIQDNKCKHPSPKKTHIYDKNSQLKDMNWTRFYCQKCDKGWTEDGIV